MIRLITTYEEAKALKEAGWPQIVSENLFFYTNHGGPPFLDILQAPGFDTGEDLDDDQVMAPRLDELLAFLWEGGWSPTVEERDQPDEDEGQWMCTTNIPGDGAHIITHEGEDQIAAAVEAVIYILTNNPTS